MIEKEWTRRLELGFRVRVRQQQNVEDYFSTMLINLRLAVEAVGLTEIITDTVLTHYWPIDPKNVEQARKNGFVVTDYHQQICLIIRELPIRIPIGVSEEEATGFVLWDSVAKYCGNVFVTVRVVDELFTDIEPI